MKIQYYYKNLEPKERSNIKSLVEERLSQIDRLVAQERETVLEVKGERTAKKSAYIVEFVFRYGGKRFVSREDDHTIREAVDFAFQGLVMQLRKKKQLSTNESSEQSQGRKLKDQVRFTSFEGEPIVVGRLSKKEFFSTVERYLGKARAFVRGEIRFLERTGQVLDGEIEADELVDDVILDLWKRRDELAGKLDDFLALFYRKALELLKTAVREYERSEEVTSLEAAVHEHEREADDDQWMDFWQPDDALAFSDTLALPKQTATRLNELRALVVRELSHVSLIERQAFNLVYQSGLAIPQAASILKKSSKEVEQLLRSVIKLLRKNLG